MSKIFPKIFCTIICIVLLCSIANADTPRFYLTLKTANIILPFVDYGLTLHLINSGLAYEANPIPALYIDKPLIAVPIMLAASIGYNLMTDLVRKCGWKGMSTIFQVAMVAVRVFLIGNSLGIMIRR